MQQLAELVNNLVTTLCVVTHALGAMRRWIAITSCGTGVSASEILSVRGIIRKRISFG